MASIREAMAIGATKIAIPALGASVFPYLITAPPMSIDGGLRWISGGSLEILPNYLPAPQNVAGATAGSIGYLLGTAEQFSFEGPASMYVGATGSTCVFGVHWHMGSGATLGF